MQSSDSEDDVPAPKPVPAKKRAKAAPGNSPPSPQLLKQTPTLSSLHNTRGFHSHGAQGLFPHFGTVSAPVSFPGLECHTDVPCRMGYMRTKLLRTETPNAKPQTPNPKR